MWPEQRVDSNDNETGKAGGWTGGRGMNKEYEFESKQGKLRGQFGTVRQQAETTGRPGS